MSLQGKKNRILRLTGSHCTYDAVYPEIKKLGRYAGARQK